MFGGAPTPSLIDLARAAIQPPHSLLAFNPFLAPASCVLLVEAARVWLQLCVLEDRLQRICELAAASEESKQPLLIQVRRVLVCLCETPPSLLKVGEAR